MYLKIRINFTNTLWNSKKLHWSLVEKKEATIHSIFPLDTNKNSMSPLSYSAVFKWEMYLM